MCAVNMNVCQRQMPEINNNFKKNLYISLDLLKLQQNAKRKRKRKSMATAF